MPFNPSEKTESDVLKNVYENLFWVHKTAKKVNALRVLEEAVADIYGNNSADYSI